MSFRLERLIDIDEKDIERGQEGRKRIGKRGQEGRKRIGKGAVRQE